MTINPATVARLVQLVQASASAPRGAKQALKDAACAELGISAATLHRHLSKVTVKPDRKRRSDCGDVLLSREEAITISALLMTSQRKTNKRLLSIGQAVDMLRANGAVRCEHLDAESGELMRLTDSAIARGLRHYSLHPDQLNRPTPAVQLKSLHPNHVWQIDASICVLYYLNARTEREAGLQVMDRDKFYKNKPANLKRIEADRVWSYEVTDHNSGTIFVNYVMGAESGTNLAESFIAAVQKRDGDPMHGVPFILMMDMGSANTSGMFANLARRLNVKLIPHAPGNARATGQVEKARDQIERSFESGLRLQPVRDLAELNACAQRWAVWYNANKIHSRHGKTRFEQWLTIGAEQLRIAPPASVCFELLTHTPELRQVSDHLTVSFKNREYCVRTVPNVMVGEKLPITINPYVADAAMVVMKDASGNELLHSIPVINQDDAGFSERANTIGEDFARPADTLLDTNRKEVERFAYDAATDEEAAAKRKAGAVPLGSRIDPYKAIAQAPQRSFMPRHGTDMALTITTSNTPVPARVLTLFEVAGFLAKEIEMSAEKNLQVQAWYPDGVPEDELPALKARLSVRANMRVVAGGAS